MYLTYFDDSGSDPKSAVVLVGGVVIRDDTFSHIESLVEAVVLDLIPEDKRATFKEFHATELYWGQGPFQDIPQADRYEAIRRLLNLVVTFKIPFIYSGVDRMNLAYSAIGSADPVDIAFRMCALHVHEWLKAPTRRRKREEPLPNGVSLDPISLFIFDDTQDGKLKERLRKTFKELRGKANYKTKVNRLPLVHDGMYFGSSAESIGIQLADICNLFMLRHLRENISDEFYDIFEHQAICAKPQSDWTQYRDLFRAHRR